MTKQSLQLSLATLLILIISYFICGNIPVGGGAGWDGAGYLRVIENIGDGILLKNDPYHVSRLPGFAPLILASFLGWRGPELIYFQTGLNIVLMAIAAGLFFDALAALGKSKAIKYLSTLTLVFSWPFIIMPVYYPILSDNIALFLSCLSLWCWARLHQKSLYMITLYSLWVMPGLFIIPFILSIFPASGNHRPLYMDKKNPSLLFAKILLAAFIVFKLVQFSVSHPQELSDDFVTEHGRNLAGTTALIQLKLLSAAAAILCASFAAWTLSQHVFDLGTWKSISIKKLAIACILFALNVAMMYFCIDWSSGFKGPPLLNFMYAQTLALPLKPLIAHFIGLNPVIIVALGGLILRCKVERSEKAVELAFLCFVPALFFGSESRQWIGALPVGVFLMSMHVWSLPRRVWCFIASILIVSPALLLKTKVSLAHTSALGLQSPEWQYYFSRQGPWMSVQSYEIALIALVVFLLGFKFADPITDAFRKRFSSATEL